MRAPVAVITFLLAASSAALGRSEDREVAAFDSVQISAGILATIELGPRRPVHLEADDALLAELETTVEGGTLHVGFKPGHSWRGWRTRGEVRVTIQTPDLRAVGASGGAIVRAALSRAEETELDASGGGEIHARGLDAGSLLLHASGGAVVEVSGRTERAEIELSGGARAEGAGLQAKDLRIHGSGGAEAELTATGTVRGGLSGGSQLHLRGKPSARVGTSGGSSVDYLD